MIFPILQAKGPGQLDQTVPDAPTNVTAQPGDTTALLTWFASPEPDLAGYNVYRSTTSGSGYSKIQSLEVDLNFTDTSLSNGTTYYYVVTVEDEDGNESVYSDEVSAAPASGGSGNGVAYTYYRFLAIADNREGNSRAAWREIKGYESNDNTGTNVFIANYSTALASSALNEDHKPFDGDANTYWDSFPQVSGDYGWIYVQLNAAKTVRSVTLDPYADFWQPEQYKIQGSQDGGSWVDLKTFTTTGLETDTTVTNIQGSEQGSPTDTTPPANPTGLVAVAGEESVSLNWDTNTEGDLAGYNVYRSTTSGSGFAKVSSTVLTTSSYFDNGLTNGTPYYYKVTAEDDTLPANESGYSSEVSSTPAAVSPDPVTITTVDVSWQAIQLKWTQDTGINETVILQRKTGTGAWPTPNFEQPQSPENWIRVGSKAYNYYDINLEQNTTYYYRVAAITNASDWSNNGTTPTLTSWKYGVGTTDAVNFQTFRVTDYGADPTGSSNSYEAILNCKAAASAAKTATNIPKVVFPNNEGLKGQYKSYPVDASVQLQLGQNYVSYANRSNYDSYLFTLESDFIIEGELSDSGERPELQVKQWNDQDSTSWLARLSASGSDPSDNADLLGTNGSDGIVRHAFAVGGSTVKDCQVRDLHVNGTAYPVNRGKGWYSADEKKYQWDISHKGIAFFNPARNILTHNCKFDNFRAECLYVGGQFMESWKISDCEVGNTNSSAISMSTSLELVNTEVYDASNAGIESAIFHNHISQFNGEAFTQYHLVRDCKFYCLDQRTSGVFKNLPGETEFGGIYLFNEAGSWWDISNTDIYDMVKTGLGAWYGIFNASTYRLRFQNTVEGSHSKNHFYIRSFPKDLYLLAGGMNDCLFLETTIDLNSNLSNGSYLLYTIQGNSVNNGNVDNVIFDNLHVNGNGYQVNRVWMDQWVSATGRDPFTFKNWSKSNLSFDGLNFVWELTPGTRIQPDFDNVDFGTQIKYHNGAGEVFPSWNRIGLASSLSTPPDTIIEDINLLKDGSVYYISPAVTDTNKTFTLPADASWNTWGSNQTLTGTQSLAIKKVVGQNKMELA